MPSRYRHRKQQRQRRHNRIRNRIIGTAQRPRVCVFRSLRHFYLQAVDDIRRVSLTSASTLDKDLRQSSPTSVNVDRARQVGERLAEHLKDLQIDQVVFDRGGYLYHGRVKAACEALRSKGIKV